ASLSSSLHIAPLNIHSVVSMYFINSAGYTPGSMATFYYGQKYTIKSQCLSTTLNRVGATFIVFPTTHFVVSSVSVNFSACQTTYEVIATAKTGGGTVDSVFYENDKNTTS